MTGLMFKRTLCLAHFVSIQLRVFTGRGAEEYHETVNRSRSPNRPSGAFFRRNPFVVRDLGCDSRLSGNLDTFEKARVQKGFAARQLEEIRAKDVRGLSQLFRQEGWIHEPGI